MFPSPYTIRLQHLVTITTNDPFVISSHSLICTCTCVMASVTKTPVNQSLVAKYETHLHPERSYKKINLEAPLSLAAVAKEFTFSAIHHSPRQVIKPDA